MTVGEFVNGYVDCAINNVPLEEAKAIAAMFPTYNIRNEFDVYVELGWAKPVVHMHFSTDGSTTGLTATIPTMRVRRVSTCRLPYLLIS